MTVAEGEVHSLVGQNGSGKSTLIKVLAGYHEPDAGASATVHGEPLELGSSSDAHRLNVRFVHQDLGLVNDLSITENIMLGRRYLRWRGGAIDWKAARVAARDLITRAGSSLDVRRTIGELGIADRTRVAIARALPENDDPSIIVLDEPTAALPARDVEQLFGTIRHLTQAGNAVVLVSHHLDEILGISDSITVLRDGVRVATVGVGDVNHDSLVHLIIGKELVKGSGRAEAIAHLGSPTLTVGELSADSVLDVSAALHPGEIVGVAGLAGSGRELLAGLITGRLSRRGVVTVAGAHVPAAQPKAALAAGMAWISGERARYGTFSNMNLRSNLTMGDLRRHTRSGRVSVQSERAEVNDWIDRLGIVTRGTDVPITSLSGGNQQKVLVARGTTSHAACARARRSDRGYRCRRSRTGARHHRATHHRFDVGAPGLDRQRRARPPVRPCARDGARCRRHGIAPRDRPHCREHRPRGKSLGQPPEPMMHKSYLGSRPMTTTMSESVVASTPDTPPRAPLSVTLGRFSALFLWLGFVILFGFITGDTFFTRVTWRLTFSEGVVTAMLALAFLVPLVAGVYDLSVGAMMGLSLVILNWFGAEQPDVPIALVAVGAIAVCALVGLVSAIWVVKFRVNSLIATLGMSQVLIAFQLKISDNRQITGAFFERLVAPGHARRARRADRGRLPARSGSRAVVHPRAHAGRPLPLRRRRQSRQRHDWPASTSSD